MSSGTWEFHPNADETHAHRLLFNLCGRQSIFALPTGAQSEPTPNTFDRNLSHLLGLQARSTIRAYHSIHEWLASSDAYLGPTRQAIAHLQIALRMQEEISTQLGESWKLFSTAEDSLIIFNFPEIEASFKNYGLHCIPFVIDGPRLSLIFDF